MVVQREVITDRTFRDFVSPLERSIRATMAEIDRIRIPALRDQAHEEALQFNASTVGDRAPIPAPFRCGFAALRDVNPFEEGAIGRGR